MKAFAAPPLPAQRQSGFSLIVSLLMLIVIIILGVGAANMALNEERGSRNYRDRQIAFQAAEAALKDAEQELLGTATTSVACNPADTAHLTYWGRSADVCFDGRTGNINGLGFVDGCSTAATSPGLCETSIGSTPIWESIGDKLGDSTALGAGKAPYVVYGAFTGKTYPTGGVGLPSVAPRYIIERVPKNNLLGASYGPPDTFMYRVTAIGFGPNSNAQVVLQSVVNTLD
jgi:type IV pilus assembly protein PilX